MVAGQLAELAGEAARAIGEQQLGLAVAAGIPQQLAGGRVAGVVLVADAECEIAQRNPASLAAPARVDDLLAVGQQRAKRRAGLRRVLLLQTGGVDERAGGDTQRSHRALLDSRAQRLL